jgi:hypothetical protein
MLRRLVFICVLVHLAGPATAGPNGPHVAAGHPYAAARQALIKQGFAPVPFLSRYSGDCPGGMCQTFPEVISCSLGLQRCNYLYRQVGTGKYWVAGSTGEGVDPPFPAVIFNGISLATRFELEDLERDVIVGPDGRPFRLRYRHPPAAPDPPLPLCSDNGGAIPCWVKPPPRYRRPK